MLICQVDGLVALMEGDHIGPFNLGNPGEFTMLELAKVRAQKKKEQKKKTSDYFHTPAHYYPISQSTSICILIFRL